MNGNISAGGITADLEAMQRIGIGEANIVTVASGIPAGPVPVMSPRFFDMVQHAAREAERLGMTLSMNNCPGWSNSGGPWVKPEHAMQFVTRSETIVQGPRRFSGRLAQPPTVQGFYRDIAVFAFRTPAEEDDASRPDNPPKISSSSPQIDPASLIERGSGKPVTFPVPAADAAYHIQIEYSKPVAARTVMITAGPMRIAGGRILASDDGVQFRVIRPFTLRENDTSTISLGAQPVMAKFFRLQFDHAAVNSMGVVLYRIEISGKLPAADFVVQRAAMVDLTSDLKPDGSLTWNVPEGHWTILRLGHTPTGRTNHPAPPEATGLECDKFSPEGLDACWSGMMQPILDRLGPLAGKVLDACLIDSYEVGRQNWTRRMIEEFERRRGYNPTPFLPVIVGRIVDSPEVSERFRWDMRRTIADLYAEHYFGYFTELCHRHGLTSLVEPYTGPFESLQSGAANDVPMGEFWAGQKLHASVKMAASIGHIYGKSVIGAESFTGQPDHGNWTDDPYSLKALGDLAFCAGINRFIFHRFAHQPWLDRYPGMTMGKWGINLDRTNTWFEMARPWMQYLTRSQFLLQQGRSVADVAYFCGQSAPVVARSGKPSLPKGFDYDDINADVLLTRARVVDHRIVLASGASYAVLVLPETDPEMTPQLLRRLRDFVHEGAVVVGPRPHHSPSLQDFPNCDREVQALAAEVWGNCDGKTVTEHAFGRGRVIWGQSLDKVLANLQLPPDFQTDGPAAEVQINTIHRTLENADIYFVANHDAKAVHQECTFRVAGRVPELWHSDTGTMEPAPAYRVHGGRTTIPLDFDPSGSVFVVFRQADSVAGDHVVSASRQLTSDPAVPLAGPWALNFPPHWGAPAGVVLDRLISWADHPDRGVRYFSGTATYRKDILLSPDLLVEGRQLTLDLGEVKNLARVTLNGMDLGTLWKPPFRVDISPAARPGTNHLEIKVVNLWPNRLIGDEQLPEDVEWVGTGLARLPQWLLDGKPSPTGRLTFATWHHITKDMPLLPSGLLGPVTLTPARWVPVR